MKLFATLATTALSISLLAAPLLAQQNIEPSKPGQPSSSTSTAPATYTQDQLLTATVHQAWLLSGKNEDAFFGMVQQLAEISAKNRDITLPESADAGRRMGNYIKRTARADTDQLLFAVVDKAVVMVAHAPAHPAGHTAKPAAATPAK